MDITENILTRSSLYPERKDLVSWSLASVEKPPHQFEWLIHRDTDKPDLRPDDIKYQRQVRNPTQGGQKGIGTYQQIINYLHENMADLAGQLFTANYSKFSMAEIQMIQKIMNAIYMKGPLVFVSEKQRPDLFQNMGPHRAAITGSTIGSPIYFNLDLFRIFEEAHTNDFSFKNSSALNDPNFIRMSGSLSGPEKILDSASKETMAKLLGILIHEFGHHTGIKDDPQSTLDQLGDKFSALFLESLTDADMSFINQPWIKFRTSQLQAPGDKNIGGRLYLFDSVDMYDLTEILMKNAEKILDTKIQKIWVYNMRWEKIGKFDWSHFSTPVALQGDLVLLQSNGEFKTVPIRIVSYVGPPGTRGNLYKNRIDSWWQETNGQIRKSARQALVGLQIQTDKMLSGIQTKPIEQIPLKAVHINKKQYYPSETVTFNLEASNISALNPQDISLEITSDQFISSGFIKKARFKITPKKIQKLADGTTWIQAEWTLPPTINQKTQFKIDKINWRSEQGLKALTSTADLSFEVIGEKPKGSLENYGNAFKSVMGPIKTYPMPWLGFRADFSTAVPLEFTFNNVETPTRILITGTVQFRDHKINHKSQGLLIDLMSPQSHPLVEDVEWNRNTKGQLHLKFKLRIPKTVSNQNIDYIMLHSIYLMDSSFQEIFENTEIGIKGE